MKIFACLSLSLIFCAHAQEGSVATKFFYARAPQTEIELSPASDGGASFEFRVYGDVREGRVVYHGGDVKPEADGTLRYQSETEEKKSALKITGKLGDDSLKIEAIG